MRVKALFTGYDLVAGNVYEVIEEYDSVYELKCETGIYCRNKDFFKVIEYVLVSQGIEIFRTDDKEKAQRIMDEANKEYYEYLEGCSLAFKTSVDNEVFMYEE